MEHDVERPTAQAILAAARAQLLAVGFAGLSRRKVATQAGVPLSQLHYHWTPHQGARR